MRLSKLRYNPSLTQAKMQSSVWKSDSAEECELKNAYIFQNQLALVVHARMTSNTYARQLWFAVRRQGDSDREALLNPLRWLRRVCTVTCTRWLAFHFSITRKNLPLRRSLNFVPDTVIHLKERIFIYFNIARPSTIRVYNIHWPSGTAYNF